MSVESNTQTTGNPVTDHLDLWSRVYVKKAASGRGSNGKITPYGIQKLRELILELAVRGKLVPQDPSDEPANALLERIVKERELLIQRGKLRKQRRAASSEEDAASISLAHGWSWCALKDLCVLENGDRSKNYPNKSVLVESGIPFVNAGHLQDGRVNQSEMTFITEERFELLKAGKFTNGDILFCLRGSLGKSAIVEGVERGAIASSLVIVRTLSDFAPAYLHAYFDSPFVYGLIRLYDNGTAQPNLSAADLGKFLVPVPPVAEQHRIVAKVDELMALCDQLEQQQTDSLKAHQTLVETLLNILVDAGDAESTQQAWNRIAEHFDTLFTTEESIDQLKQTILQLAVMGRLVPQDPEDEPASVLLEKVAEEKERLIKEGKIRKQKALPKNDQVEKLFDLPDGWQFAQLDSVVDITSGVTKGRKLAGRILVTVPYLRVANVQRGFLDLDVIKEIEIPEDELEKFTVVENDLLITEGGDWDKVGRTAIWRSELPLVAHQNHVFKARCILPELNEIWLEKYLNSPLARDYFAGSSKQTTNLASINKTQLRGCMVAIPPLSEQHHIVAKINELMALCDSLKSRIQETQTTQVHLADTVVEQAVA